MKQISFSNFEFSKDVVPNKNNLDESFKEVKIYKELKHPNIIKFQEAFLDKENLYIVMEYMEGFNLSELIKINSEKVVILTKK